MLNVSFADYIPNELYPIKVVNIILLWWRKKNAFNKFDALFICLVDVTYRSKLVNVAIGLISWWMMNSISFSNLGFWTNVFLLICCSTTYWPSTSNGEWQINKLINRRSDETILAIWLCVVLQRLCLVVQFSVKPFFDG